VFNDEFKLAERMAPSLQKVLIVDPLPASARLLAELMRSISQGQLWNAPNGRKAMELSERIDPHLIFVELDGGDGLEFTRKLRRSDAICRQCPVIMITATATAAAIKAARDAGVHEFLRKPYTMRDLLRRLEAVTLRPRDWVEAVEYIGPDRRRFNSGDYTGPLKRRSDLNSTPDTDRILQALKIIRSAVGAVESDPRQALRAMLAQGLELQKSAMATANTALARETVTFQRFLAITAEHGIMVPAEVAKMAAPLLAFLPKDEAPRHQSVKRAAEA
jgi:CheY-like chemotaxis protein